MQCPACGHDKLYVTGNKKEGDIIDLRVRICQECSFVVTTGEKILWVDVDGREVKLEEYKKLYAEEIQERKMTALRLKHNCEKLDALEMFEEGSY
jgi:transcriptional regulator NrdR family protein